MIKLYSIIEKKTFNWLNDFISIIKNDFNKIIIDNNNDFNNSNNNIILTWTNKKCNMYNQYVREKLFNKNGYILCGVNNPCFNAFFIRKDVAKNHVIELGVTELFENHPIFSKIDPQYWLTPDESWEEI